MIPSSATGDVELPTIGDRIREVREGHGWTQDRLATETKISKGFLSEVENNKRNISTEYVLRIATVLGASLDYLLKGESGREERERAPVTIPRALSQAAEDLELTYGQTLTLLEAHQAVVARRANQSIRDRTVEEWKSLHAAISRVYPDGEEPKK